MPSLKISFFFFFLSSSSLFVFYSIIFLLVYVFYSFILFHFSPMRSIGNDHKLIIMPSIIVPLLFPLLPYFCFHVFPSLVWEVPIIFSTMLRSSLLFPLISLFFLVWKTLTTTLLNIMFIINENESNHFLSFF